MELIPAKKQTTANPLKSERKDDAHTFNTLVVRRFTTSITTGSRRWNVSVNGANGPMNHNWHMDSTIGNRFGRERRTRYGYVNEI